MQINRINRKELLSLIIGLADRISSSGTSGSQFYIHHFFTGMHIGTRGWIALSHTCKRKTKHKDENRQHKHGVGVGCTHNGEKSGVHFLGAGVRRQIGDFFAHLVVDRAAVRS